MVDLTNYPRAVLESCEAELIEEGVPAWFVADFTVADEVRSMAETDSWGRTTISGYQWSEPIVRTSDGWHVALDLSQLLKPHQWQTLELAAVARDWLSHFGERSPYELSLACEFSRLDALRNRRMQRSMRAKDNAEKSTESRRESIKNRNRQIGLDAWKYLKGTDGKPKTERQNLVSKMHQSGKYKNTKGDPLSRRTLRTVLQELGILPTKKM